MKLTESASVITGHGETLYFKVLSGGPGIQRWYSMHAMLGYLQLYAHKENHPLAPIVSKQHPVSFWTYTGLQRDKKNWHPRSFPINWWYFTQEKIGIPLKKVTNNSLSKGEMFYRNISNFLLPLVRQRTASRSKRGRSQLDNKRLWPLFTDSVE